ncbi:MAG: GNAT family N-acetyltransferase [Chloroflexi bacterium]|nr:GNAT family N-acetyltransferase [Chloroflexota bacterium]
MNSKTLSPHSYTIYSDRSGFDALRLEWNPLLRKSRFNSVFLAWEWQTTWWDCLGTDELFLVAFRDQAGQLIGIAPLFCRRDENVCHLHLVGCAEVADYLDIISIAGREREVYSAFLDFLTGPDAPDWTRLLLCNLYEPSSTYRLFPELARTRGLKVEVKQEDVAPYILLPDSFEAYLAGLSKKQRHEIRRKRNKLTREAQSWRWFQVRGGDNLDEWVDAFLRLHRLASAEKEAFMTEEMAHFFHQIAHTAAEQGWLALAFIEVNEQLAATVFNFDYDDRIWVYNSGYDPQAYKHLSPGIVLNSHLIEDAIQTGHKIFDFLQGDEVYKYRFGAVDAKVMQVEVTR